MNGNPLNEKNWRSKLGLFPMPLFQDKSPEEKFILLNGGMMGNLCLDFRSENIADARSFAWSADVGHYLTVIDNVVTVYKWDSYKSNKYEAASVGAARARTLGVHFAAESGRGSACDSPARHRRTRSRRTVKAIK